MVYSSDQAHEARPGKARRTPALVIAIAALLALAACSGSHGPTAKDSSTMKGSVGSVPEPATGKQYAGTITYALAPNSVPIWIFPLNSSFSASAYNVQPFQWQMWRPLYWTQNGAVPEIVPSMSLARRPVWSDNNKTLTITMNSAYKWSDGQPVTSRDVLFDLDLMKAAVKENPANWVYYTPGYFPDNLVSATTPSPSTLVLKLSKPVNPTWFEEDILATAGTPFPSHAWAKDSVDGSILDFTKPANAKKIYDFLIAQNKSLKTYATNPLWKVVDGPYHLSAYNPTSGAFTMVPNPSYGGPHAARVSNFQGVPFTSNTAEQNALKTSKIDVGYIDYTAVPQIPSVRRRGYNVFGIPTFGSALAAFNFKNATGHFGAIASQLYFRQALAHLQDQEGWIKAYMHGAGVPNFGPIPTVPPNHWVPDVAKTNPYPFNVAEAIRLLKSHGWTIRPGGTDTCTRPGTGPDACGAGIPAGTRLAFNLIYANSPALYGQESANLAATAKQAGITISLSSASGPYIASHYANPYTPATINKWAMQIWGRPGEPNLPYPTQFGFLNTGGVYQAGSYSNPTADKLINASIYGNDPEAVRKEAAFLTLDEPVLWQPIPDIIFAWKNSISGPRAAFENFSQYYVTPEFWYLTTPQH
ncbi:ABC transporter substrate-binding protein [Actinomadura sp. DC4]|uniref:ABC transporter substrate-binding protein n=1 Tax=Actinomadura sp. DC4 TaxID=3055069 RepID=UPI0025AF5E2D|nr:ABC transporter substrate-binding protein [Actinomadura sp. DC4]MDN3358504.1 ABC transporter substrate-binding protein [Actinomadura sp. DC4]